jgi:DNA-binding IclR family transcriptional regulator
VGDRDDPAGWVDVLRRMIDRGPEPALRTPVEDLTEVTSMAAPVRDPDGRVVMALHLMGFDGSEPPQRLRRCRDRLLAAASRASARLAG